MIDKLITGDLIYVDSICLYFDLEDKDFELKCILLKIQRTSNSKTQRHFGIKK